MASIAIENLNVSGLDLFSDSESFLNEVGDREMSATVGGITPSVITFTAAWGTISVSGVTFGTGFAAGVFGAGAIGGAYVAYKQK
jgi:hypothetical protein